MSLQIEFWLDINCPWCYLGLNRLRKAISSLPFKGDIELYLRAFELDPIIPRGKEFSLKERLIKERGISSSDWEEEFKNLEQLGKEEGISFHFDKVRHASSFDALQLMLWAQEYSKGLEILEALEKAYFEKGEFLGDHEVLIRIAVSVGLKEKEAREVLQNDLFAEEVQEDQKEALLMGVRGVPYLILESLWAIGALQPVSVYKKAIEEAYLSIT